MFANLPQLNQGFLVGDQAVYYAMSQSLAYDGDLEYTTRDLIRYENDFWAGPNGIFLKRVVRDGREHLYYAKSFAFPLFAAPFGLLGLRDKHAISVPVGQHGVFADVDQAVGAATEPLSRAKTVWYRSRSPALSARLM